MSTLLPPNSSPLERAVEAATTLGIETPINTLWNPDECQADALPWLAWALHVDNWDDAATEATSIKKPRREGPPATANGMDDISAIMRVPPPRRRWALRLGR